MIELHQSRALLLTSLLLTGLIRKRLHHKNRENRNPRHDLMPSLPEYSENLTIRKDPKGPTCWAGHCSLNVLSFRLGYTATLQLTLGSRCFSKADSVSKLPLAKCYATQSHEMKTFCIGRRILHSENNHLPRTAFTVLHLFCLQHPATMPIQCRKQLKSFPLLWSTCCSNSSGKSVPSAKVQQPATEASLISNMTPLWMEPEISGWTSFAEKSQIASRLKE